jgi:hypothetical protein
MSTLISSPADLALRLPASTKAAQAPAEKGVYTARRRFDGTRGLAAMVLAALVAGLVVVADQVISTWADDHLLVAWVLLWLVVFAGMALFASTARRLANTAWRVLDDWSRTMAEARAEARLWDMARSDPRLMSELVQARMRECEASTAVVPLTADDFEAALAPLGMESHAPVATLSGWDRFIERLAEQRRRNMHLHYI